MVANAIYPEESVERQRISVRCMTAAYKPVPTTDLPQVKGRLWPVSNNEAVFIFLTTTENINRRIKA